MEEIQCFQKIKRDLEEGEETRLGWVEDYNFGDGFCCREGRGGRKGRRRRRTLQDSISQGPQRLKLFVFYNPVDRL